MSGAAIRVQDLGKMYRIGGRAERYRTLRDTVSQAVLGLGHRVKGLLGGENGSANNRETIWALKNVSFELQPGEVVGVIGRNGAGKSTLLKILSRITEPTQGRVEVRGKVASLLEVGTGFHPELTGRENVYLNGAILGMRRDEVRSRFEEIVAFAEVQKFIDTPVKHYSSGMYLRLAFAVASHLDADILLVDEVLAVGDARFHKKCMTTMGTVANSGKTVMFVTHNLAAVREMCPTSLLIDGGRLIMKTDSSQAVKYYSELVSSQETEAVGQLWSGVTVKCVSEQDDKSGIRSPSIEMSACLLVKCRLLRAYIIAVIENAYGGTILNRRISLPEEAPELLEPGRYTITFTFESVWLAPGAYLGYFKLLGLQESEKDIRDISSRVVFDVPGSSQALGKSILAPPLRWTYHSLK